MISSELFDVFLLMKKAQAVFFVFLLLFYFFGPPPPGRGVDSLIQFAGVNF